MRWRQCAKTGKFIPVDDAARRRDGAGADIIVRGKFDSFVSPVDGSLIRNHRDLENHNKRNDVVNAAEFTPEFYAEKRKKRERLYKGELTRQESLQRKQQIYEIMTRMERQHGH